MYPFIELTENAWNDPQNTLVNQSTVKTITSASRTRGTAGSVVKFIDGTDIEIAESLDEVRALLGGKPAMPLGVAQLLRDIRAYVHATEDVMGDDDDFIERITAALGDECPPPDIDEGMSSGPIAEADADGETCCHPGCSAPATRWELTAGSPADMVTYACDRHSRAADAVAWLNEAVAAGEIEAFGIKVVPWSEERAKALHSGQARTSLEGAPLDIICRLAGRQPTAWVALAVVDAPDRPTLVVSYPSGAPSPDPELSEEESAALAVPLDDIPDTMAPGMRFKHPTIAHFRFAEECGYTLAKYGPGDYEVQSVPKGWRLVRNTSAQMLKRQGDFVLDAERRGHLGRVVSANPAVAHVEFMDGETRVLGRERLVHVEGDAGADSEETWAKQKAQQQAADRG